MDKEQARWDLFKLMTIEFMLWGRYNTIGDFVNDFERRLINRCGECFEEDKVWAGDQFHYFVTRNAKEVEAYEKQQAKEREKEKKKKQSKQNSNK